MRQLTRVGSVVNRAESDDLEFALDACEDLLNVVADSLRGGRRVLTPIGVKRFQREVAKHLREVRRAFAKLGTAIAAQPLAVPGAQPPPEPEKDAA